MNIRGILIYCLRAGIFAAAVCAVYALFCRMRKRPVGIKRLLAMAYIAALVQITVLRGGVDWQAVAAGGRAARLIPLQTTRQLLGDDLWLLIYNVAGNLLWFVPLGMILGKKRAIQALLWGAVLSACIEMFQFLLMTGITDIDDVILNALGALMGWGIVHAVRSK